MTTTHPPTTEAIVCPAWCLKRFPSDPELGNPDRTYLHVGAGRTFSSLEAAEFSVELSVLLKGSGEVVDWEPTIWLDGRPMSLQTARQVAEFLLALVERIEARP